MNGTTSTPTIVTTEQELTIEQAIGRAYVARVRKLHRIYCELAELEVPFDFISPDELLLLEENGFMVDFDRMIAFPVPDGVTA